MSMKLAFVRWPRSRAVYTIIFFPRIWLTDLGFWLRIATPSTPSYHARLNTEFINLPCGKTRSKLFLSGTAQKGEALVLAAAGAGCLKDPKYRHVMPAAVCSSLGRKFPRKTESLKTMPGFVATTGYCGLSFLTIFRAASLPQERDGGRMRDKKLSNTRTWSYSLRLEGKCWKTFYQTKTRKENGRIKNTQKVKKTQ